MKSFKRYSIHIAFLLTACGASDQADSLNKSNPSTIELSEVQVKAGGIQTAVPVMRAMGRRIPASGSFELPPQQRISISSSLGGYVKSTHLLEGMHVHRGEALVELSHPDFIRLQEKYWEALERKQWAEHELTRQRGLQAGEAGALKNLQQAESEFNTLSIQLSSLSAQLQQLGINPGRLTRNEILGSYTLRAAQDGFVNKVNMHIGKFVGPQEVLVELFDPNHLHAELHVAEKDAPLLREKQPIRFRLGADQSKWYAAEVHLIGKSLTPQRTVLVHGHLKESEETFIPGLYLQAEIEVGLDTMLSVPESAIVRFGGRDAVMLELKPNTFKPLAVQVLARENGWAGIHSLTQDNLNNLKIVIKGAAAVVGALNSRED